MHVGKTLFAQVMEFVPWTSFARIVQRHGGNAGVRMLSCAEQFRAMAFAQLTWRESLRDIEVSLSANASKLYAMGFRSAVKRSTLADANESRNWMIRSDLAAILIRRARKLYSGDALGIDLDNTVYALDSSTIDLCLSLFEWAPFRSTKAAIKLHTLLDLRGAIPAFIHISDGKLHDVNVLDLLTFEAGAFYVMDRGYVDFARLYALHQTGAFFVTRNTALPNAVKTQVWCAVATYVLIAIVKKELQLDASLYSCLQILSVSVFEKSQLSCALQPDPSQIDPLDAANQLNLFSF